MQKRIINLLASEKTAERIALAVFIIFIALIAFGQVSYNDFWWHLALGKWMIAKQSFLMHDIFSYTFEGKLWLNSTWLYDGILYLLYSSGSYQALNALRFIIIGATYFFFIRTARLKYKPSIILVTALFLLTIPSLRNFYRPEITQPLFIGTFLYILYSYKYFKSKLLYTLPFIEILWVNVHGSFHFGPVLIGIFLGSELLRTLFRYHYNVPRGIMQNPLLKNYAIVFIMTGAATLINPYGYGIYPLLSGILADTESLGAISEWQPTTINFFLDFRLGLAMATPLLFASALYFLGKKIRLLLQVSASFPLFLSRIPFESVALLVGSAILMIQHVRFNSILTLISALVLIRSLPYTKILVGKNLRYLILLLIATASIVFFNHTTWRLNTGQNYMLGPVESIDFIRESGLTGNILNEYADGGELTWRLYPEHKVFIDGRTPNLYDGSFYWKYRSAYTPELMQKLVDQHDIQIIIWPVGSPLLKDLLSSESWALAFFDNYAGVYIRRDGPNAHYAKGEYQLLNVGKNPDPKTFCKSGDEQSRMLQEIQRSMSELHYPSAAASMLANIIIKCEEKPLYQSMERLLSHIIPVALPSLKSAFSNYRGTLYLRLDQPKEAISDFKKALEQNPANPEYLTNLGSAYFNSDEFTKAEKTFAKALRYGNVQSLPAEFYKLYGWTLYHLDNNEKALDYQLRYFYLTPPEELTREDYLYLSSTYRDSGDTTHAEHYALKARELE